MMFELLQNPVVMFDILDVSTGNSIQADCTDLRQQMESFEYDEDITKVGQLTMTFNNPDGIYDEDERLSGDDKLIRIRWGYITHLSPEKTCVIRYVSPEYPSSGNTKLKVIAWDAVSRAYMRAHPRNWGRISTSEIAKQVAYKWNLLPVIPEDSNDTRYKPYIQPGKTSDLQYLKFLARRIGWECWSDGLNLYYGPDRYDEKPALTAVYKSANFPSSPNVAPIVMLDFSPDIKHGKLPSGRRVSVDTQKKKTATHKTDDKDATTDDPARKNLGAYDFGFDTKSGEYKSLPPEEIEAGAGKVEPTPETNPEQVKKDARAAHWMVKRRAVEATANFIGNPELRVRRLVEVLGVSEVYSGKWKITKSKHSVKVGGTYQVSCSFRRPGKGKGKQDAKSGNQNTTAAEDQTDVATAVPEYKVDFARHETTRGVFQQ